MKTRNTGGAKSIQRRLTGAVLAAIVGIGLIGCSAVYFFAEHSLFNQLEKDLNEMAGRFVSQTEHTVEDEVDAEFHEAAPGRFGAGGDFFYELRAGEETGEVIVKSVSLDRYSLFGSAGGNKTIRRHFVFPDGRKVLVIIRPFAIPMEVLDEDEDAGELTEEQRELMESYRPNAPENQAALMVGAETLEIRQILKTLLITLCLTGAIGILATFLVVSQVIRGTCEAIQQVVAETEMIVPGDPGHERLSDRSVPLELQPLVSQFNALLDRVDSAMMREREFSADVSHELRTPVSELRALIDVALINKKPTPHSTVETLSRAEAICKRLTRLIEVIGAMHLVDSATHQPVREDLNPADLLRSRMPSDRIELTISANADRKIVSDPVLLTAIFDNVIGNAIAHSPKESAGIPVRVELRVDLDLQRIELITYNTAPDLTSEDLEAMKLPFWRKEKSRTGSTHFGLGLTLVQKYVDLLDGEIRFDLNSASTDHPILKVSVRIPCEVH